MLYLDKCEFTCINTTVLVNYYHILRRETVSLLLESLKNYAMFIKRPLGVPSPVFVLSVKTPPVTEHSDHR